MKKGILFTGLVVAAFAAAPAIARDDAGFDTVSPSLTCDAAYTGRVNRDFIINVMTGVIQSAMAGESAPSAASMAQALNRYAAASPTGDMGMDVIARTRRAFGSVGGGNPAPIPDDNPVIVMRARARAAEMLPTLGAACAANPNMSFLAVMQHVLHDAGYGGYN